MDTVVGWAKAHKVGFLQCFVWSGILVFGYLAGIGTLTVIACGMFFMLANLGEREEGTMSAYSVFNEGCKEIGGTLNASQFEREIRHQLAEPHIMDDDSPPQEEFTETDNNHDYDDDEEDEEDRQLRLAIQRSLVHTSGATLEKPKVKKRGKKKGRGVRRI